MLLEDAREVISPAAAGTGIAARASGRPPKRPTLEEPEALAPEPAEEATS